MCVWRHRRHKAVEGYKESTCLVGYKGVPRVSLVWILTGINGDLVVYLCSVYIRTASDIEPVPVLTDHVHWSVPLLQREYCGLLK